MLSRRSFLASAMAGLATPALADPLGQRPGIQLYTVGDALSRDVPGTLKALGEIGYRVVETAGTAKLSPQEFRKRLDDAGLTCASAHLDLGPHDNGKAFAQAHSLGARFAVSAGLIWPLGGNPDHVDAALFGRMAALANRIGEQARQAGLVFALHNHNFEFQRVNGKPGYDLLLEKTDPALVHFEIDCGWMRMAGFDPVQYLRTQPARFPLLHIKDFVPPPDPSTHMAGHPGTVLGQGFIDYRPIFAAARQVQHYFVEQEPPYAGSSLAAARADYDWLHRLI